MKTEILIKAKKGTAQMVNNLLNTIIGRNWWRYDCAATKGGKVYIIYDPANIQKLFTALKTIKASGSMF